MHYMINTNDQADNAHALQLDHGIPRSLSSELAYLLLLPFLSQNWNTSLKLMKTNNGLLKINDVNKYAIDFEDQMVKT